MGASRLHLRAVKTPLLWRKPLQVPAFPPRMLIDQILSSLSAAALGRIIGSEPWAQQQLAPHAGKQVAVRLEPFTLTYAIEPSGQLVAARGDAPGEVTTPNVMVTLTPQALLAPAEQRLSHIRIEGDAGLAHALGDVAGNLRLDVEHELAKIVGDIPAHQLATGLNAAFAALKQQADRTLAFAVQRATQDDPIITPREPFTAFAQELRALRDQLERLSKRIELLERA
jgi:ubiquinone biosynthesis accessory factor UbiJ